MLEALAEEKRLRSLAKLKQQRDGEPVTAPAGVLLERGIKEYAEGKRAANAAGVDSKTRKAASFFLSGFSRRRKQATSTDLLDAEVRPPPDEALPPITPQPLKDPVTGKYVLPPASKPAWPHPVDYRVAQLATAIDFVMEVR